MELLEFLGDISTDFQQNYHFISKFVPCLFESCIIKHLPKHEYVHYDLNPFTLNVEHVL